MTKTPETDAAEFPCMTWPSHDHPMVVRAEYARELKRERDEARATCSELVTDNDAITLARTVVRITQERDEARAELAEKEDCIDNWMKEAKKFKGERDRLAAALKMITTYDYTDGQRTTDAGGWMNYCLEAEKELTTTRGQRDRLLAALKDWSEIREWLEMDSYIKGYMKARAGFFNGLDEALQSLTPNEP